MTEVTFLTKLISTILYSRPTPQIPKGFNWNLFMSLVLRNGFVPLVYERIQKMVNVPQKLLDKFENLNMGELRKALLQDVYEEKILDRFMKDLDFNYQISNELYRLYRFCMEKIAMCRVKKDLVGMDEAKMVLERLHQSFVEVAKTDHSAPLMSGAAQLVTGMTYGKNSLNETYSNDLNNGYII